MGAMFEMTMPGIREFEQALGQFAKKIQSNIMRTAIRRSGNRLKNATLLNMSGIIVGEDTGRTVTAMEARPVKTVIRRSGTIVALWPLPSRASLGIPRYRSDTGYYLLIGLEYGTAHRTTPLAPIRTSVNQRTSSEFRTIGRDLGKGIKREWAAVRRAAAKQRAKAAARG